MRYRHITQAENAPFYISVKYYKVTIISLDLIPLKKASDKYFLTLNQLSFNTQQVSSVSEFFRFSNVRQMTWISNHTLMILERRLPTKFGLLKFVNFSAQTHGYININSSLLASFAIDENLSCPHYGYSIFYTWVNDSIYITSLTTTYRLTQQQLLQSISNMPMIRNTDHHTYGNLHWQPVSICICRREGREGKQLKS